METLSKGGVLGDGRNGWNARNGALFLAESQDCSERWSEHGWNGLKPYMKEVVQGGPSIRATVMATDQASYKLAFGKHRGKPITEVDTAYLAWIMRMPKAHAVYAARAELRRRGERLKPVLSPECGCTRSATPGEEQQ